MVEFAFEPYKYAYTVHGTVGKPRNTRTVIPRMPYPYVAWCESEWCASTFELRVRRRTIQS